MEYSGPQCSFARHDIRSYRHPSWADRRHSGNLRCVIFISPRAPHGLRPRSCQGGIRRAAAVSSRADERTRTADLLITSWLAAILERTTPYRYVAISPPPYARRKRDGQDSPRNTRVVHQTEIDKRGWRSGPFSVSAGRELRCPNECP